MCSKEKMEGRRETTEDRQDTPHACHTHLSWKQKLSSARGGQEALLCPGRRERSAATGGQVEAKIVCQWKRSKKHAQFRFLCWYRSRGGLLLLEKELKGKNSFEFKFSSFGNFIQIDSHEIKQTKKHKLSPHHGKKHPQHTHIKKYKTEFSWHEEAGKKFWEAHTLRFRCTGLSRIGALKSSSHKPETQREKVGRRRRR